MRYIDAFVRKDLKRKMVFIGGPRQVGKTTISNDIMNDFDQSQYFNYLMSPKNRA